MTNIYCLTQFEKVWEGLSWVVGSQGPSEDALKLSARAIATRSSLPRLLRGGFITPLAESLQWAAHMTQQLAAPRASDLEGERKTRRKRKTEREGIRGTEPTNGASLSITYLRGDTL